MTFDWRSVVLPASYKQGLKIILNDMITMIAHEWWCIWYSTIQQDTLCYQPVEILLQILNLFIPEMWFNVKIVISWEG